MREPAIDAARAKQIRDAINELRPKLHGVMATIGKSAGSGSGAVSEFMNRGRPISNTVATRYEKAIGELQILAGTKHPLTVHNSEAVRPLDIEAMRVELDELMSRAPRGKQEKYISKVIGCSPGMVFLFRRERSTLGAAMAQKFRDGIDRYKAEAMGGPPAAIVHREVKPRKPKAPEPPPPKESPMTRWMTDQGKVKHREWQQKSREQDPLREAVTKKMQEMGIVELRKAAVFIGIPHSTLDYFIVKKKPCRPDTLLKIQTWVNGARPTQLALALPPPSDATRVAVMTARLKDLNGPEVHGTDVDQLIDGFYREIGPAALRVVMQLDAMRKKGGM